MRFKWQDKLKWADSARGVVIFDKPLCDMNKEELLMVLGYLIGEIRRLKKQCGRKKSKNLKKQ